MENVWKKMYNIICLHDARGEHNDELGSTIERELASSIIIVWRASQSLHTTTDRHILGSRQSSSTELFLCRSDFIDSDAIHVARSAGDSCNIIGTKRQSSISVIPASYYRSRRSRRMFKGVLNVFLVNRHLAKNNSLCFFDTRKGIQL